MKPYVAAAVLPLTLACGSSPVAVRYFPITLRLALVNQTTDSVFVIMADSESAYPGIARVVPADSACTDLYAFADSVPVDVHSLTTRALVGSTWVYATRAAGWRVLVNRQGVSAAVGAPC